MASNRTRHTVYPALQSDSGYGSSGGFPAGSENMSRSDSGYDSNLSNRPGYYGDLSSIPQEETEDYQCDDSAMAWQQYNLDPMDATYDRQLSNYMVEGTGSQMAGYCQDSNTPRTAYAETWRDVELENETTTYLKGEQYWSTDLDTFSHYAQDTYHNHAGGPNALSPFPDDVSSTTYFEPPNAPLEPSASISTSRRRLPSSTPRSKAAAQTDGHLPSSSSANATSASTNSTNANTTTTTTNKFPCLAPSCSKQFNRAADLDRHMKFIHCKSSVSAMTCDYRRCPRHANPFHRADHFRDHLRDQHKEDLLKRGESAPPPDARWWRERSAQAVYQGWWRCSKCFARVVVEGDRWQCGRCGNYCEGERQGIRRLPRVCDYDECRTGGGGACGHGECVPAAAGGRGQARPREWLSPAAFREHLRVAHGEDVPVKEGREGNKELGDEEWRNGRSPEAVYNPVWRCTRCLEAVDSREEGFACGACGFECEEIRRGWHGAVQVVPGSL